MVNCMSKLMILDGNNILLRALFAPIESEMTYNGESTGVLYRCMNMVFRHLREFKPTHFICTFDHGRSEYRLNKRPEYKANRDDSRDADPDAQQKREAYLYELHRWQSTLEDLYLNWVSQPRVEADDIIASLCHGYPGQKLVISSDHDLRQLASPSVRVHAPAQNRHATSVTFDPNKVREKYGCTPDDLPKMWALSGDKGDNIIGLHRVGEKTALKKLIEHQFDFPETVEALAKTPEDRERVLGNLDLIELHPELFTDLPDYTGLEVTYDLLQQDILEMSEKYGFDSFKNRIDRLV